MNNLYRALAATARPNQELTVDLLPDLVMAIQDGDYAVASMFWGQAWDELELLSKVRRWVTDRERALCRSLGDARATLTFREGRVSRSDVIRANRETANQTIPAELLTPPDGKQALLELLQLGVAAQLVFSQSSRAGSPEHPTLPTQDDPAQDTPPPDDPREHSAASPETWEERWGAVSDWSDDSALCVQANAHADLWSVSRATNRDAELVSTEEVEHA